MLYERVFLEINLCSTISFLIFLFINFLKIISAVKRGDEVIHSEFSKVPLKKPTLKVASTFTEYFPGDSYYRSTKKLNTHFCLIGAYYILIN